MLKYSFTAYVILFITISALVAICVTILLYISYSKKTGSIWIFIGGTIARWFRVLALPLLHILMSPCRCFFWDGSMKTYHYDDEICYDFPFLVFIFIGVFFSICVVAIGILDSLFLLDKYRSIKYWTSSTTGRVYLSIFILQLKCVFLDVLFTPQRYHYVVAGCSFLIFLLGIVIVLFIVRFLYFYHYQQVFLVSTLLTVFSIFQLSVSATIFSKTYNGMFSLTSLAPALIILWILLSFRYLLLLLFFSRRKIRSNFLLCNNSTDLAIGIFTFKKFSRSWKKCCCFIRPSRWFKRKKSGRGGHRGNRTSIEMIEFIQSLLDDENFEKTKSLCSQLIALVMKKYPLLARGIMNHTNTVMNDSFADIEFSLEFYRMEISNFQQLGATRKKKGREKHTKIMTQLGRASRREEYLSKLMRMMLQVLDDGTDASIIGMDDRSTRSLQKSRRINFSNFDKILSTIQEHLEFCENLYESLTKVYPSPITFRRYANFLRKYKGDRTIANVYLREANHLEFNNPGGRTESFADSVLDRRSNLSFSIGNTTHGMQQYEKNYVNNHNPEPQIEVKKHENLTDEDETTSNEEKENESSSTDDCILNGSDEMSVHEDFIESNSYVKNHENDKPVSYEEDGKFPQTKSAAFLFPSKSMTGVNEEEEKLKTSTSAVVLRPSPSVTNVQEKREETILIRSEKTIQSDVNEPSIGGHSVTSQEKKVVEVKTSLSSEVRFGESPNYTSKQHSDVLSHISFRSNEDNMSEAGFSAVNDVTATNTSTLIRKVENRKSWSYFCIYCYCLCLLIFVLVIICTIFSLSFVLKTRMTDSAEFIRLSTKGHKAMSEAAYFMRKLQNSYFPESMVHSKMTHERNQKTWKKLIKGHCTKVRWRINAAYRNMTEVQRRPFSDLHLDLRGHLLEKGKYFPYENEYKIVKTSLIDSVNIFLDFCSDVMDLKDDDFMVWYENINGTNYIRQDVMYDDRFFFGLVNEPQIHDRFHEYLDALNDIETETAYWFLSVYVSFPVLTLLFVFFNCCVCCVFRCEQKRTYDGLLLIPKHEIRRLIRLYSDSNTNAIIPNGESKFNTKKKDERGAGVRVETNRFSMIQQFFCYSCFFIIICCLVFCSIVVLGGMMTNRFINRNREYDRILRIEAFLYRVNIEVMDHLYPNTSFHSPESVKVGGAKAINDLVETYKALRFGSDEMGINGNDDDPDNYEVYYDLRCDPEEDTHKEFMVNEKFWNLYCQTMTRKVDMIQFSAENILNSDPHNISYIRTVSDDLVNLNMVVTYSNGSLKDEGCITDDYDRLKEILEQGVDSYLNFMKNFSLLLFILFMPLFAVIYICTFRSFASKLNQNLSMVRQIMLLMSREVLMGQNIYEYISGKNVSRSVFGSCFRTPLSLLFSSERTNRMNLYAEILGMSSYGFVSFDRYFNILHFNNTADELFRIKACGAVNLRNFIKSESIKQIKKWMSMKLRTPFSSEVLAKYEDQEYAVLCDISRSVLGYTQTENSHRRRRKNKKEEERKRQLLTALMGQSHDSIFVGLFENLESAKKKDFLKATERRAKQVDLLMRNILPKKIAESSRMEDFEEGRCMVYEHKRASAVFVDICDFSGLSKSTSPETIINVLHTFFTNCDVICEHHDLEKIKTIGDCYFAVSGIPDYKPLHAASAMNFAIDVNRMLTIFNEKQVGGTHTLDRKIEIRTGISSGKLVAAVLGKLKRCYDIWGSMINEAARMESLGIPGKIQVSRATYESVYDRYEFIERELQIQGVGTNVICYVHTPDLEKIPERVVKDVEKNQIVIEKMEKDESGEEKKKKVEGEKEEEEFEVKENRVDEKIEEEVTEEEEEEEGEEEVVRIIEVVDSDVKEVISEETEVEEEKEKKEELKEEINSEEKEEEKVETIESEEKNMVEHVEDLEVEEMD